MTLFQTLNILVPRTNCVLNFSVSLYLSQSVYDSVPYIKIGSNISYTTLTFARSYKIQMIYLRAY
jgi:hypothetical protein